MKLWNNIKLVEKGEVIQDDQEAAKELNTFSSSSFSFTLKENSTYSSFLYQTYLFLQDARIVHKKKKKKKEKKFSIRDPFIIKCDQILSFLLVWEPVTDLINPFFTKDLTASVCKLDKKQNTFKRSALTSLGK